MNVYTRHIVSATIAFTVYFFIIFLLFVRMQSDVKIIKYSGYSKNNIDIFQDFNINETLKLDNIVKQTELPKEAQLSQVKEEISLPTPPKKINLNDMFSSIPSPSQDTLKKEIEEKHQREELARQKLEEKRKKLEQIQQLSSSAYKLQENLESLKQTTKNVSNVVSNLNEVEITKPTNNDSKDDDKYDEWYQKVARITADWKNQISYYKAAIIVVRVSVDGTGKFNFMYIVKSSGFSDYDSITVAFLQKLEKITFPIPPNGARQEFNVSFTSKLK